MQDLTRRQARWALFLSAYDFFITHKAGKLNGCADAFSRRPDFYFANSDDNKAQTLLPSKHFQVAAIQRGYISVVANKSLLSCVQTCTNRDHEVSEALKTLQDFEPVKLKKGLEEWNEEQGFILYQGRVYVPLDNSIRKDIVQLHHDSLAAGHPGQAKTLELVSQNYWWPGMTKFINGYINTCDTCNHSKPYCSSSHGFLKPHEVEAVPWKKVAGNFIVKLPISKGYNSILVTGCMGTKQVHFIPCNETIDTDGTAQLYIANVFKLHGAMEQFVSNRGPQFASKFLKEFYKGIGVKRTPTTAYHHQGDGFSERWNQELEQSLRIFCSYHQDNWVRLLSIAKFAFNARVHSATGKTPFFLNYSFTPEFHVSLNPSTKVPMAKERLEQLKEARDDANSALKLAAEHIKYFYDQNVQKAPTFEVGDKVWLSAENIKTT